VILTRKRLYTQATKNLEKAKKLWDGEESELAQVHNALGFCYFNMDKVRGAGVWSGGGWGWGVRLVCLRRERGEEGSRRAGGDACNPCLYWYGGAAQAQQH
jgi:hypothetical protein